MSQEKSLLDKLASAVTDIREKLVEEPWFGKTVTQSDMEPSERASVPSGWPTAQEVEPSFGSHTHTSDREQGKELSGWPTQRDAEAEYEPLPNRSPTLKELPGWPTQRDAEAEREQSRNREQDKGMER